MGQIRRGSIQLTQGSALVRHVWTAIFTTVTAGPFVAGNALTWGANGEGTVIRYDSPAKTLYFVRTAGALPIIGDTIVSGATSAAIVEMGEGDPPNLDVLIPGPLSQTVILAVSGATAPYFLSAAPGPDSFNLSAPWGGDSAGEASYGLHTALSAWGLPILEPGDTGAPALISYALGLIEARAGKYVHVSLNANAVIVPGGTVPWDRVVHDPDGWFQAGGAIRVPVGVSLIEVEFNAWTSGGTSWSFWLTKNAVDFDGAPYVAKTGTAAADGHSFKSGPIEVAPGDLIRVVCGQAMTIRGGVSSGKYSYIRVRPVK